MLTYRIADGLDVMYISEMPKDQRPSTILRENPSKVTDLGLVCTILGTDVPDYADEVLERINTGDYEGIRSCRITAKQADRIIAAIEFARRLIPLRTACNTPGKVFDKVRHYADTYQEHFIVVSLDGAHNIISSNVVTVGLVNRTLVHPREVFAGPLKERAAAIVLAHNHPSGNLEPSPDDLECTRRIKKCGDLLGIDVLDHIIFSTDGYMSMAECGMF